MTPSRRPWPRSRWLAAALLAGVCLALTALAVSAADDGLTYYRTPTEAAGTTDPDEVVRVGGLVVPGSVVETATGSSLVLTDGATDVPVRSAERLPATVQEGEGAVVEGRFDAGGVLRADRLLMRHSNEYRPPGKTPGGTAP